VCATETSSGEGMVGSRGVPDRGNPAAVRPAQREPPKLWDEEALT
jgi:hypothetical protein